MGEKILALILGTLIGMFILLNLESLYLDIRDIRDYPAKSLIRIISRIVGFLFFGFVTYVFFVGAPQ